MEKSLQNGPIERFAHRRNELEVHLRRLPEALQLAAIDFVDGLNACEHGLIASSHSDIAKKQSAVEPAVRNESELFGRGV